MRDWLPSSASRSGEKQEMKLADEHRSAKATKPLILLVDHSRGALMFQETVLRRRQKVVTSATSGRQGLEMLRHDHPRLVIFGYELHDMKAPEFCREVRHGANTKSTSLLFVADRQHGD